MKEKISIGLARMFIDKVYKTSFIVNLRKRCICVCALTYIVINRPTERDVFEEGGFYSPAAHKPEIDFRRFGKTQRKNKRPTTPR